jgi:predicted aminopeptidase
MLALAAAQSGCGHLGYYWQSASGHLALLRAARPVQEWLDDPQTPAALRSRLQSAQRLRNFAVHTLHLPDNASYRRYADLGRAAVVWNVVAAPELSLQLKTWCFPVLGCVGYRGYFREAEAQALAEQLRGEGWEVSVYGVPAYSTLGKLPGAWMADPLLSTFIAWPEVELGRLMFHELAHQVAYANDDTSFNESFATAVERLGAQQWLRTQADEAVRARNAQGEQRRAAFRALVSGYRAQLEALYRSEASVADKRAGKARLLAQMRADYAQLKVSWQGWAGYDDWFARANNATLAVQSAYDSRVEDFERWFRRCEENYVCFYREARRLAALPAAQRQAALAAP